MTSTIHAKRPRHDTADTHEDHVDQSAKGESLKAEMDALLDEIDEVLNDVNAEEFVKNYVQAQGQ